MRGDTVGLKLDVLTLHRGYWGGRRHDQGPSAVPIILHPGTTLSEFHLERGVTRFHIRQGGRCYQNHFSHCLKNSPDIVGEPFLRDRAAVATWDSSCSWDFNNGIYEAQFSALWGSPTVSSPF